MALTEENGIPATMLVGPASFGQSNPGYYPSMGSGFGGGWGDGSWIILLIIVLLAAGGGWGNNTGFGGQPVVVNDSQRGFDQAAVMSGISGVQSGIQNLSTQLCGWGGDIQTSLCNGFAGVNATVNSGFANAETAANARQMANMQQAFAGQTAMAQGFNQLGTQFANCCCENRLASADLKYTIATENCADRAAISDGIRDVIENCNRNNQRILDQLCSDKIDAKNEKIADLERQLTMANLAASQTAQTSRILADNAAQTVALEQYLNPVPVPAYMVQNPNCCPQSNYGCGGF